MSKCKCGNKTILATAYINYFNPNAEPYENGIEEECGYEDGIPAEASVGIHWCPKCEEISDIWIEEPMEKDVRDEQLEAKNEKLRRIMRYVLAVECIEGSFRERAEDWLLGKGESLLSLALREKIEQVLKGKNDKD